MWTSGLWYCRTITSVLSGHLSCGTWSSSPRKWTHMLWHSLPYCGGKWAHMSTHMTLFFRADLLSEKWSIDRGLVSVACTHLHLPWSCILFSCVGQTESWFLRWSCIFIIQLSAEESGIGPAPLILCRPPGGYSWALWRHGCPSHCLFGQKHNELSFQSGCFTQGTGGAVWGLTPASSKGRELKLQVLATGSSSFLPHGILDKSHPRSSFDIIGHIFCQSPKGVLPFWWVQAGQGTWAYIQRAEKGGNKAHGLTQEPALG